MEQKKKEYVSPDMKVVKLNASVVLLQPSNDEQLGQTIDPCDTDRLA